MIMELVNKRPYPKGNINNSLPCKLSWAMVLINFLCYMKKIYFVSLIMLVASMSSMAQVKFGIETGMTASRIVSGQRITESAASSAGVQIGLVADFTFSKKWLLMSGLSFLQKEADSTGS